jgi:microcystin-dependent protein
MEPFMGEIRIFAVEQAPKGWALCNGQFLPINQNQALYSLLGTNFGGNGQTTFQLPDFRARIPIHTGAGHTVGERAGESAHTLSISEIPQHVHFLTASSQVGNSQNPRFGATGHLLAQDPGNVYNTNAASLAAFAPGSVSNVGGSQPHQNMQPYLALSFCIALQGLFPTPN